MNTIEKVLKREDWESKGKEEINQGSCKLFAEAVNQEDSRYKVRRGPLHTFLYREDTGLYYDSECPEGAEYPDFLPFYCRCHSIYDSYWMHLGWSKIGPNRHVQKS
jgi:hypothetical protein